MNTNWWLRSFILISFAVCGCATAECYKKPGVDFSKYKRCAVVQFHCSSNPSIGQEVADAIALEFMKKGYDVIERSQLESVLDEDDLRAYGLTESSKSALRLAGVNAIVTGSVSRYSCHPSSVPIFYQGAILGVMNTSDCHASVSLKMLDVGTGEVLWAANGSHSENAVGMTAQKVLHEVLDKVADEIPG
jgi:curli biogenesis system outer membrane secretion channel CsgG